MNKRIFCRLNAVRKPKNSGSKWVKAANASNHGAYSRFLLGQEWVNSGQDGSIKSKFLTHLDPQKMPLGQTKSAASPVIAGLDPFDPLDPPKTAQPTSVFSPQNTLHALCGVACRLFQLHKTAAQRCCTSHPQHRCTPCRYWAVAFLLRFVQIAKTAHIGCAHGWRLRSYWAVADCNALKRRPVLRVNPAKNPAFLAVISNGYQLCSNA